MYGLTQGNPSTNGGYQDLPFIPARTASADLCMYSTSTQPSHPHPLRNGRDCALQSGGCIFIGNPKLTTVSTRIPLREGSECAAAGTATPREPGSRRPLGGPVFAVSAPKRASLPSWSSRLLHRRCAGSRVDATQCPAAETHGSLPRNANPALRSTSSGVAKRSMAVGSYTAQAREDHSQPRSENAWKGGKFRGEVDLTLVKLRTDTCITWLRFCSIFGTSKLPLARLAFPF